MMDFSMRGASGAVLLGGIVLLGVADSACGAVVGAGDYEVQDCAVNADCAARGEFQICEKTTRSCVALTSPDCPRVVGEYQDDDAFIIGGLLALTGTNQSVGLSEANALDLAVTDFKTNAEGLPPKPGSTKRRPVAAVICDDAGTNDVGQRSADHMANRLKLPVIVGPTWSGVTLNLLSKVTIPSKTLVIGSGTTSPDFTSLEKGKLYYRTVASMEEEVKAIAAVVEQLEALLHEGAAPVVPAGQPIKVAAAYKGDSFGKGSTLSLLKYLEINGALATSSTNDQSFIQQNYGNTSDPNEPLRYDDTKAAILAHRPHVIVAISTQEVLANVVKPVEAEWPSDAAYRPYWVFSHSQFTTGTRDFLNEIPNGAEVRKRFVGAYPASESQPYQAFRSNFRANFNDGTSPDSFAASNTYDAVYVAAFAAAALGATPITGTTLSEAIARLVSGDPVVVGGAGEITKGLSILAAGGSVNLEGASGPIDFDLQTGDVLADMQIFCVPGADGKAAGDPTFSGFFFDATTQPVNTFQRVVDRCWK